MRKTKKQPSDYGVMSFRLPVGTDIDELNTLIQNVLNKENAKLKEGESRFKKNEILLEALKIGLNKIQQRNK